MKNIFIGGVARSGKSTFAKMIKENGNYNYIPLDYFTSSLKHNFPETNITSNVVIDPKSSENLALLLSRVISIMNNTKEKYLIDSAHIMPKDIMKYIDLEKWDVYYVGYPNVSSKDKFDIIRKYDSKYDWTSKRSDEELLEIVDSLINLSKEIESQCQELNITFIDTSKGIDVLKEKWKKR